MSYLDDSDHSWELEEVPDDKHSMEEVVDELCERSLHDEALETIFQGYAGLKARFPTAPDYQCLFTSMVWYFG